MGKRELLLVAAFLIVGVLVYQVTAPPPAPGERSFSLSQFLGNVRRAVRGNRAFAETTSTTTEPVAASVTELRLDLGRIDITITGEDRTTIEAELKVRSNGFDQAEAEQLAKATALKLDEAGTSILGRIEYPDGGRQTATISLKVPKRLAVRLEASSGDLTISQVAAVELLNARGQTHITTVAGRVTATQTGGELRVTDAGSLKLTTRGSDATLERVRGDCVLNFRNGEVKGSGLAGAVEMESNGTDITLEKLETTTGTLRASAVNGTLTLRGLRTDGRIDARNAEVTVEVDRAAPLAIYADGPDDVIVTAPAGGYQLDAVAQRGRVTLPEGSLRVEVNGQEQRARGAVRGGGGTITIRSTRGDILVRDRAKAER